MIIPSHKELVIFWLQAQTTGRIGEINKTLFPDDYKDMLNKLDCFNEVVRLERIK